MTQSLSTETSGLFSGVCSSCPDLVEEQIETISSDVGVIVKAPIRQCLSSDDRIFVKSSPSPTIMHDASLVVSSQRLAVPDVFTTSFTRSPQSTNNVSDKNGKAGTSSPTGGRQARDRHYRHSAPEIGVQRELLRDLAGEKLPTRGGSLKDRSGLGKGLQESRGTTRSPSPNDRFSQEPYLLKVIDDLYLGNTVAAYNLTMLCKANIRCIIDVSNASMEETSTRQKNCIPCACSKTERHSPAVLRLNVSECDLIDIKSYFSKVNKFIEGGINKDSRVLIFGRSESNLSVLMAMQYLIHERCMDFRQALAQIMKSRSDVNLGTAYVDLLVGLQAKFDLSDDANETFVCNSQQICSRKSPDFLPREAWADN